MGMILKVAKAVRWNVILMESIVHWLTGEHEVHPHSKNAFIAVSFEPDCFVVKFNQRALYSDLSPLLSPLYWTKPRGWRMI